MKKTYKIDVDCANCANKMEDAAKMCIRDKGKTFMQCNGSCQHIGVIV